MILVILFGTLPEQVRISVYPLFLFFQDGLLVFLVVQLVVTTLFVLLGMPQVAARKLFWKFLFRQLYML